MNENVDPYEVIRTRYESNVNSFILSDLFQPTLEVDEELINDIENNELVIYTAFTGDYDSLKEPEFIDKDARYVCFTQNPDLKSDTWEIIQMEDSTLDDNRIAKQYKVFPNRYFPDFKYSFWLDGTFKIKGSIREYVSKYINSSMLTVVHPERDCIFDEAAASMHFPRYSNYTMSKQVEKYRNEGMPLHYGLPVLGALFRKHDDPEIVSLMDQWWKEIIIFTNQDQLSFSYLMWKNNFHPSVAPVYYWINEYWTKEGEYHHNVELEDYITSRNLIKSLEGNIQEKNTLSKEEITLLFNDIDALRDEAEALNQIRNHWDRQITDIQNSTSWKLTSKLRSMKNKGD
ncbi:glycosyltransferase domain-containing protein [Methanobrevibacter millerae]|uniref:TOD1/MUCI70 glycosyltransferase-like domain-containing protein n=1 Tax=Methanobrevibacter millerae TaxID=230361 RepID=A0A1G5WE28_9EURY|nr:glycosyltransferase domain-containing protein [Methanobrevibacter millerae]SDA55495.1 Protein of unknown function [Methanobrevibacter millerae]